MALQARPTANTAPSSGIPGDRYAMLDVLGEGTYGVVYRALDKTSQKTVAVKKIRLDRSDEGIPQTALREVSILQEVQHPHIVNLLDVICGSGKLYLVFEFVEMDLKKSLDTSGPVNGPLLKRMVYQMLEGLYFCHRHRIVHRDLKPANILVTADKNLKLADFGLARAFMVPMQTYTHEVVTLWYRAPEILLGEPHYAPAVDVWSVGCIMAEISRGGKVLFRGDSEIGQLFEIFQVLGTPNDLSESWPGVTKLPDYRDVFPKWLPKSLSTVCPEMDPQALEILSLMLIYNPARRITAKEALMHPWFNDIRPRTTYE